MRFHRTRLLAVAIAWSAPAGAQLCDGTDSTLAASRDLYCLTLVPADGFDSAAGHVELARIPGPFTIALRADGQPVYEPVVSITGLPAPAAIGATRYVAWAAPPVMYPMRRLGVVENGHTHLAHLAIDPFVIVITAEPGGRPVLRGQSPSSRLQPADFLQFAAGATRQSSMQPTADTVGLHWTSVPMSPKIPMLPGEMALRPLVTPILPHADGAPAARPHETLHLTEGDTLHLTASLVQRTIRGHDVTMYSYNGQIPGPLLVVQRGSAITVEFTNDLDQPTSVHWHGIRLDNAYDGVPGLTQQAVPPGGHFTYQLRFPDAGIFWYHPHVREDMQQDLGLYGNILVEPSPSSGGGAHDRTLVLDDLLVTFNGLVPYGREAATHALMGRFGNVLLVNGAPAYHTTVRRGSVIRFRLTNASNTRVFNLSFPGARMKLTGSDVGRYEHQSWVESVVIAPAERYTVEVRFGKAGRVLLLNRVRTLDHLFGQFHSIVDTLGAVEVRDGSATAQRADSVRFGVLRADSGTIAGIDRYRRFFARPPDRTLLLSLVTHNLPFVTHQLMLLDSVYFAPIEWTESMPNMNWAATSDQVRWVLRDPATGKENMDIDWSFRRDTVIKLRLVNDRNALHGMQHPIHLHGQRFLVLAANGVPNTNLVWKDTVLVPAGSAVDILLDLANPGRWMLHCHIAEHLTADMMTAITVE